MAVNSRIHMTLQSSLAVFAGGACGSMIRISLSRLQSSDVSWPWMTILINFVGSFVLGCLLEYLGQRGEDIGARRLWRLGIGTGVIGGFTTYSTFILESDTRLLSGMQWTGLAYLAASVVGGLVFAGLGIVLGNHMGKSHGEVA